MSELALLYTRDLTRLAEEVAAFPTQQTLWATLPGVSNSAGHITLHLEGNLREFIGRQLGTLAYTRNRPQEFAGPPIPQADLLLRVEWLKAHIPAIVTALSQPQLEAPYPEVLLGRPLSTSGMLIHLSGHLQWHLGQIDYLRRILTGAGAIPLASL